MRANDIRTVDGDDNEKREIKSTLEGRIEDAQMCFGGAPRRCLQIYKTSVREETAYSSSKAVEHRTLKRQRAKGWSDVGCFKVSLGVRRAGFVPFSSIVGYSLHRNIFICLCSQDEGFGAILRDIYGYLSALGRLVASSRWQK